MKKSLTLLTAAAMLAFVSSCTKEGAVQHQQDVSSDAGARTSATGVVVKEDLPITLPEGFYQNITDALTDVVFENGRIYFYLQKQDGTELSYNLGRSNGAGDNPSTVTDAFSYKGVAYAYGKHYSKGNVVYTPRFNGGSVKLVDMLQTLSGAEVDNGTTTIGTLRARQNTSAPLGRVYIEQFNGTSWVNIGRTNGNTDDGTLKEFFVVNGVPFAVLQRRETQFIVITPRGNGGSVKLVDIVDNDFQIIE